MSLHTSIVKIQSTWRGYITRKRIKQAKLECQSILEELDLDASIGTSRVILSDSRSQTNVLENIDTSQTEKSEQTCSQDNGQNHDQDQDTNIFSYQELQKTRQDLLKELTWIRKSMTDRISFLEQKSF